VFIQPEDREMQVFKDGEMHRAAVFACFQEGNLLCRREEHYIFPPWIFMGFFWFGLQLHSHSHGAGILHSRREAGVRCDSKASVLELESGHSIS